MYMLGVCDYVSVLVRVDWVATVPNRFHGKPELEVGATIKLSPNAEEGVRVILWADSAEADSIVLDDDFVARDVILEGSGGDSDNPYDRGSVGMKAIWFGAPCDEEAVLALIRNGAPQ